MRRWRLFLELTLLLGFGPGASGYALIGSKWNVGSVTMHLELGAAGTLIDGSTSWDAVAAGALGSWSYYLLRLQFVPVVDSENPSDNNGVNNVFFSKTIYGEDFADAVAVTTEWDAPANSAVRREADVILNSALSWNSYRGPLLSTGSKGTLYDLRRVLLHEFGHVVGLDHPDEAGQSVVAIMNSHVSDIDSLQADDIAGGQFLYGAQPGTNAGDIATIDKPKQKTPIVGTGSYLFMGSADPNRVQAVFLVNSRFGAAKFFRANGLSQWRFRVPLKPGRNVVSLYVRGPDGLRRKVGQRVVTHIVGG